MAKKPYSPKLQMRQFYLCAQKSARRICIGGFDPLLRDCARSDPIRMGLFRPIAEGALTMASEQARAREWALDRTDVDNPGPVDNHSINS